MSETETTFTNLARRSQGLSPIRETMMAVLGVLGIGSTRVDIDAIISQPTPESMTTWLQTHLQVQQVIQSIPSPANDSEYISKKAA